MVDWLITGFKGGIVAVTGFAVNYYRKPFYKWAKAQINLNEEFEKVKARVVFLENESHIIKSEQMADIHTDVHPTFKCDIKGNLVYANPAWVTLFEYSDPENAYGLRFMDIIHPDDYERVKAIHRDIVSSPTGFNDPIKFKTKRTKQTINTICVTELIHDKNNLVVGTIGRLHVLDSG